MTATRNDIIVAEPVPAKRLRPRLIAKSDPNIQCPSRFDGLHLRFRSVMVQVLRYPQRADPAERSRFAFVKRLFDAWQALKDPAHAASPRTLWSALRRFEAEVVLAECELDCLELEISDTQRMPNTPAPIVADSATQCLR